ncbi:MAG: hypothetical protein ACTSXX_14580 [Candidatus Baldrarchaeia archaeon]
MIKILNIAPTENLKEFWNPIFEGIMIINAEEVRAARPSGIPGYPSLSYPFTILNLEVEGLVGLRVLDRKLYVGILKGHMEQFPVQVTNAQQPLQVTFRIIVSRQSYLDSVTLLKIGQNIEESDGVRLILDDLILRAYYFKSQTPPNEGCLVKRTNLEVQIRSIDWLSPLSLIEGYRVVLISNDTYQRLKDLARRIGLSSHLTIDDILAKVFEKFKEGEGS